MQVEVGACDKSAWFLIGSRSFLTVCYIRNLMRVSEINGAPAASSLPAILHSAYYNLHTIQTLLYPQGSDPQSHDLWPSGAHVVLSGNWLREGGIAKKAITFQEIVLNAKGFLLFCVLMVTLCNRHGSLSKVWLRISTTHHCDHRYCENKAYERQQNVCMWWQQ